MMKKKLLLIILCLSFFGLNAQTKTISGRIIDEHFQPLPNAIIRTLDSNTVVKSDENGFYKMIISDTIQKVEVQYIAMETDSFNVKNKCVINIILLDDLIVEFETEEQHKIRLKKRRKQLSELYKKAIDQGVIEADKSCG